LSCFHPALLLLLLGRPIHSTPTLPVRFQTGWAGIVLSPRARWTGGPPAGQSSETTSRALETWNPAHELHARVDGRHKHLAGQEFACAVCRPVATRLLVGRSPSWLSSLLVGWMDARFSLVLFYFIQCECNASPYMHGEMLYELLLVN
jgi:hypothetical protein